MRWISTIVREIFGLFVDDSSFALAVLAWIGLVWFLVHHWKQAIAGGVVLFLGLGVILAESTFRFARKRRR